MPVTSNTVYLRAHVAPDAEVRFAFSIDGSTFTDLGQPLAAAPGRWIGAKVGLFALGSIPTTEFGYADIDWFRIQ